MSRIVHSLLLSALLALASCASNLQGQDLGGGFRRVQESGGAAGDHLYYLNSDLGQVGLVSVSPSGHFAIFEREENLFLIRSSDGHLHAVTDGSFSKPSSVQWNESDGFALVSYSDSHPASKIELR